MIKATDSYNQSLKEQEEELAKKKEQDLERRKRRHKEDDYSSDEYQTKRRHRYDSAQNNNNDRSFRRKEENKYNNDKKPRQHGSLSSQCDDDNSDHGLRYSGERRHHAHLRDHSPPRETRSSKKSNTIAPTNSTSKKSISMPVVVRGRGRATQGSGSNMDKYFSKHYDPSLDVEPDLDEMVYTQFTDDDDDLKRKKKKSKRKREETDRSDDDSDNVRVESPPPLLKPIRAWDVGK